MECKNCNYPQSIVVKTRHGDSGDSILRRRECPRCGMRFTTSEKIHISKRNYMSSHQPIKIKWNGN